MSVAYAGKDACTDILLDLVAEHESLGNYNAVIGSIHASDDLGRYSLDDIYRLMDQLLAAGRPSTAVGRYQIIRKTLRGLQASKKLGGEVRFTPELQDELALSLLIARGYSQWWLGRIDDAEFVHNLSCEWASLPDPQKAGRSHYDGDGVNHAGTTLDHVYAGLRRAQAARSQGAAAQNPPAEKPAPKPLPAVARPVSQKRQPGDDSADDLNRAELERIRREE